MIILSHTALEAFADGVDLTRNGGLTEEMNMAAENAESFKTAAGAEPVTSVRWPALAI